MKIDDLIVGSKYTNNDICKAFLCSPQGGMKRSKRTNTLVLISNHIKSIIYDDRWLNNKFYYTGMGSLGNQTLKGNQREMVKASSSGSPSHRVSQELVVLVRYTRDYGSYPYRTEAWSGAVTGPLGQGRQRRKKQQY